MDGVILQKLLPSKLQDRPNPAFKLKIKTHVVIGSSSYVGRLVFTRHFVDLPDRSLATSS
jgi:hypothetical protein